MIGLAVGIDYALFVVDRYREERRRGAVKVDAITTAGSTASRAVLFSGMTVVFALPGMLIIPNNIYRSLAVGAIFVVVVAVIATLTFIPAVISLFGDRIDWPRHLKYDAETVTAPIGLRPRDDPFRFLGNHHQDRDGKSCHQPCTGGGVPAPLRDPVSQFRARIGQCLIASRKIRDPPRLQLLGTEFSAGSISPVEIVVEGPLDDPAVQQGIADIKAQFVLGDHFGREAALRPVVGDQ